MVPFRYNGMYSFKPPVVDTVSFILFKVNDVPVDYTRFLYWKKDLTEMSLQTFYSFSKLNNEDSFGKWLRGKIPNSPVKEYCISHLSNTKEAILHYPEWLYHFLTNKIFDPANHPDLKIVRYHAVFENGNLIIKDSSMVYESIKK